MPEGALGYGHALDAQFGKSRKHDRKAPGNHCGPVLAQSVNAVGIGALVLQQQALQSFEAFQGDAFLGEAVLAQDCLQRARGAR